jgi:hypothetical protein
VARFVLVARDPHNRSSLHGSEFCQIVQIVPR